MRIKIIQRPDRTCVDGLWLDRFQQGCQYDVGVALCTLLLAEGWAEPVVIETPALVIPRMEGVLLQATLAQRWRFRPVATDPIAIEPRITLRPRHRVTMILQPRTSSDAC